MLRQKGKNSSQLYCSAIILVDPLPLYLGSLDTTLTKPNRTKSYQIELVNKKYLESFPRVLLSMNTLTKKLLLLCLQLLILRGISGTIN